jgi:2,3,4,5-tetrahydropyridine-2-carboxylate N-succinyltransferase
MDRTELQTRVEALADTPAGDRLGSDALDVVGALLDALEAGAVRAAERGDDGEWRAVPWVKRGILLAFRAGTIVTMLPPGTPSPEERPPRPGIGEAPGGAGDRGGFLDKSTLPVRTFSPGEGVRVVPGGSSIRRGTYVASGVVFMPPMFVNVGSWIGEGSMVDSHALVGSCAQIGARVHLSAAAQIGGVLEPINAAPVVIEDEVVVGGNTGVYEGTVVRRRAVLGAGVVLTRGTPVYDLVEQRVLRGDAERPLEIPEGAVVVAGSRAVSSEWGRDQGLSIYTPIIVKYRDDKTDLATALEGWLR